MKELHVDDFGTKNLLINAAFPLIPIFRKSTGARGIKYNKIQIIWLWLNLIIDDYGKFGLNKAMYSKSIDTKWFRLCIGSPKHYPWNYVWSKTNDYKINKK